MSNLADFDTAILEFMQDFGFTATYIQQVGDGVYDTSTGENVVTTAEIPVEAILLDLTLQSNGMSTKFGTMVIAGDKELFVRPPKKTDPLRLPLEINTANDKIKVGDVTYSIVTMKEINPTGSDVVVYDFYVRR